MYIVRQPPEEVMLREAEAFLNEHAHLLKDDKDDPFKGTGDQEGEDETLATSAEQEGE